MNSPMGLPTLEMLKKQAKSLRSNLQNDGTPIGHSKALELIAGQHGYKDWNTLHAAAGNSPPTCPIYLGQRVSGLYLGQRFAGEVLRVESKTSTGRYRVTFDFDEAVDVVSFDSFSSFRKRVSCFIGTDGRTVEKTSDGTPQLQLDL